MEVNYPDVMFLCGSNSLKFSICRTKTVTNRGNFKYIDGYFREAGGSQADVPQMLSVRGALSP